jgi:membrane-bound ClpP family serine protease
VELPHFALRSARMMNQMGLTPAVAIVAVTLAGIALFVLALWRHKQAGAGEVKLIGEIGQVETKLDPVGTVIVCGELWRARSSDGSSIPANTRVRAVGIQGHIVLVEISH